MSFDSRIRSVPRLNRDGLLRETGDLSFTRLLPISLSFLLAAFAFAWMALPAGAIPQEVSQDAAAGGDVAYRAFPVVGSRVAIWVVAQLHLMFAAFVLAVPMFALIIEVVGTVTKDKRYDALAYEFTKLLSTAFSFTAALGALMSVMLVVLYPKVTTYMVSIFSWTFFPYVLLFFLEAIFLYTYYYGWGKFSPKTHLALGIGLNVVGTAIMFIADAWLTFMNTPSGISETGSLVSLSGAINNFIWMPINIHRIIANVAFGGSIAAAYGAYKYLGARTPEERAHYDWMGYVGNFISISALLPLPFAGYWLGKEIYAYSQSLGIYAHGRDVFLAVHHSGDPDWKSLSRRELLSVGQYGPHRGCRAVSQVHQVPAGFKSR